MPFCIHGNSPDQIYHVTVMPCYDKKLEASRDDFYQDIYRTRDVDCVITSGNSFHELNTVIINNSCVCICVDHYLSAIIVLK